MTFKCLSVPERRSQARSEATFVAENFGFSGAACRSLHSNRFFHVITIDPIKSYIILHLIETEQVSFPSKIPEDNFEII